MKRSIWKKNDLKRHREKWNRNTKNNINKRKGSHPDDVISRLMDGCCGKDAVNPSDLLKCGHGGRRVTICTTRRVFICVPRAIGLSSGLCKLATNQWRAAKRLRWHNKQREILAPYCLEQCKHAAFSSSLPRRPPPPFCPRWAGILYEPMSCVPSQTLALILIMIIYLFALIPWRLPS